jgi:protein-S-isoprenylcysteine O-methyltransferase Ste14
MLPSFIGLSLWLESYASMLVLLLAFACLVARIRVEERTLRETLPGYAAYVERVRHRLVPFVHWVCSDHDLRL